MNLSTDLAQFDLLLNMHVVSCLSVRTTAVAYTDVVVAIGVAVTKTTYRPPVAAKPMPNVLKRLEGTELGRKTHDLQGHLPQGLSNSLDTVLEKPRPMRE